jgi:pilus assembly protein Flp/PilA
MNAIRKFVADESGVTAIEYGLIAALIAAAIVISVTLLGTNINALFTKVAGHIV